MVNKKVEIKLKGIVFDNEGNPINSSSSIFIYCRVEPQSTKFIKNDEGISTIKSLSLIIKDVHSKNLIDTNISELDYILYNNKKYTIIDVKKYLSHFEIITK